MRKLMLFGVLLLTLLNSHVCYSSEKIPYKNDGFSFSMYHYITKTKQKENFYYTITKDGTITGKIRFVRYNKTGKKEVLSKDAPIGFLDKRFPEEHAMIKLLNYNDFLEIPNFTSDKKNIKTVTVFQAKYKYKGKNFLKKVKIYNIDELFRKGDNEDIIKLKFIMLYVESLEYIKSMRWMR